MSQPLVARPMMRSDVPQNSVRWFDIKNKTEDGKKVAVILIYEEIGGWFGVTAADFVKELDKANTDDVDSFEVHINSPGGDVFDGVAIHSKLKQVGTEKPVKVIVDALAASAASFIAQAGTEVVMMRNATMMIHDASGMAWGNADYLRKQADLLDRVSNNIADIYSQSNDTSAEDWRAFMREEVWYNGPEAVEAGLATSVIDADDQKAEEKASNWNLSVFNYAGRGAAPAPSRVMQQARFKNQKETNVARPTNHPHTEGENPESESGAGTAPTGDELVSSPDTAETGEGAPPAEEDDANKEANGAPAQAPTPAASASVSPTAGLVPVVVNGVTFTVPAAVASRMTVLEATVTESVEAGKKQFVAGLASDGKITAAQITSLETYALGLDNAQYDAWRATWDGAPANPLFASHGAPGSTTSAGATGISAQAQRIRDLEDIVAGLSRTLKPHQVEATNAYKELQQLKSTAHQA